MKNVYLFFKASILALIILSAMTANADPALEPCTPDCENSPWSAVQEIDVHLQNTCWTKVYYRYRSACDIWQDIQILKFGQSIRKHLNPHLSYVASMEEELGYALNAILKANVMGFQPIGVGCFTSWRVSNRSCWARFNVVVLDPITGLELDNLTFSVPCVDSDCCLMPMQVCRDAQNNIQIVSFGTPQNVNCNTIVLTNPPSPPIPCFATCNWLPGTWTQLLELPDDTTGNSSSKLNLQDDIRNFANGVQIGANTFVSTDNIHFQIYTENIDNLEIECFTIDGRSLVKKSLKVNNGINDLFIDKNEFSGNKQIVYSIKYMNAVLPGKLIID